MLFLETDSEGEKHVFRCGTNSYLHVPSRAKFVPNESLGQKLRQPLAPAWGRAGCGAGMGLRALARGPETMTRQPPAHPGIGSLWPRSSVLSSPVLDPYGRDPCNENVDSGGTGAETSGKDVACLGPSRAVWAAAEKLPVAPGACAYCEGWT